MNNHGQMKIDRHLYHQAVLTISLLEIKECLKSNVLFLNESDCL